jgi:hypothetical protein
MSWIESVRNKPQHEKIKLIWILSGVVVACLLIIWIIVGGIKKDTKKDLRVFESLGQSAKNIGKSFQQIPKQP